MKKRILSILLVSTMILGASLTVSAAELNDMEGAGSGQEITGSSTMKLPTIKITVPTTANIVINPFQMEYDADDITGNSQIISAEQEIKNESDVAVAVNVSELTTTGVTEGITIATADITSKNTDKAAFLYLEVIDGAAQFSPKYAKTSSQVIIPNAVDGGKIKPGSANAIVTLEAGAEVAKTAKFKIGGSVVANPVSVEDGETVANPWTDGDAIGVSFKFTFSPQIVQNAN